MSREVEVKNIQLTATVPEDLQISLGEITDGSEANSLAKSTSFLAVGTNGVNAPADQVDADPFDWSNSADISAYYDFGKLIPAGSTDGVNVFFTPDATQVGKTLGSGAEAFVATKATAHTKTAQGETTWIQGASSGAYTSATSYTETNDDGYYIDIPVWLRTSKKDATNVYVTGLIKPHTNPAQGSGTSDDLYMAVRVAVLTDASAANQGVVDLSSGTSYPTSKVGTASMIDSKIATEEMHFGSGTIALNSSGTITSSSYGKVAINDGTKSIATLAGRTSAQYGAATKVILRIWLEGDDINCWNANAGQD